MRTVSLDPRMALADHKVVQACEAEALVSEMRGALARAWEAGRRDRDPNYLAVCRRAVPHLRALETDLRVLAGIADREDVA